MPDVRNQEGINKMKQSGMQDDETIMSDVDGEDNLNA